MVLLKRISVSAQKPNIYVQFSEMFKATDSESNSSDIESLLSFNDARISYYLLLLRTMRMFDNA